MLLRVPLWGDDTLTHRICGSELMAKIEDLISEIADARLREEEIGRAHV